MPCALILEPYAPTGQALALILQREGWEVTLSQTGQEAQELLLRQAYDIFLVDLEMNTGEGWRVVQSLGPENSDMSILAMIDRDSSFFQAQAELEANLMLLYKPLGRKRLLASATTALQHS